MAMQGIAINFHEQNGFFTIYYIRIALEIITNMEYNNFRKRIFYTRETRLLRKEIHI